MFDWPSLFATTLAGLSVGLLAWGALRAHFRLIQYAGDHFEHAGTDSLGPMKVFLPTGRIGALWVQTIFKKEQQEPLKFIKKMINQAGRPGDISAQEILGVALANILLSSFIIFTLSKTLDLPSHFYPFFLILIALITFFPFIWLYESRHRRQRDLRRQLPYALDLLTLGVESGLDFTTALQKIVSQATQNPLSQEFALLLRDIQMGAHRREALNNFRDRIDMSDVNTLAASLIQADEFGSPLGPTLKIQSEALREKRFQRAEEQAMKTPVKIIFPLTLFILPVTGMIFLVPLILKFRATIDL